jgi:hypothetical protein
MLFEKKIKENKTERSIECEYLNKKCLQRCFSVKTDKNNIIKYCEDEDIIKWESDIYLSFIGEEIFPDINITKKYIEYQVDGLCSFRTFLINNTKQNLFSKELTLNIDILLNELFSYIKNIKRCGLIHGNLHIDNLFLKNTKEHNSFFTIDFTNSYNKSKRKSCPEPRYKRTSFIGEYENKVEFDYWDFFTLYISLKYFFINNKYNSKYILVLDKLLHENVDEKIHCNYINYILKKSI